jgi:quinol monooxygenase YgiN
MPNRRNVIAGALALGRSSGVNARTGEPVAHDAASQTSKPSEGTMKRAYVDTIVMLAELTVRPDKLEAFLEYTATNLALSRSARGNLAFDILIDEAQPNTVRFYEVWSSSQAQTEYMDWRTKAGDLTKLLSFLAAEPKFTKLRSVAA